MGCLSTRNKQTKPCNNDRPFRAWANGLYWVHPHHGRYGRCRTCRIARITHPKGNNGRALHGWVRSPNVCQTVPRYDKGDCIAKLNGTPDSAARKLHRNRAIKAVKKDHTSFVRLAIGNLFGEQNRKRLSNEIEALRTEALKTPVQGIVAALEGMKTRKDQEVLLHFAPYPIMLVLGEQDQTLPYSEHADQVENTSVKLVTYPDGHMSHIENCDDLLERLLKFVKGC